VPAYVIKIELRTKKFEDAVNLVKAITSKRNFYLVSCSIAELES